MGAAKTVDISDMSPSGDWQDDNLIVQGEVAAKHSRGEILWLIQSDRERVHALRR